jgi:antitoxin component HigA of HigAB toxin-antitoxin module
MNLKDLEKVRARIRQRGFKHNWLAGEIGVSKSTFSSFMTGKRGLNKSALILLSQKLELDLLSMMDKAS